MQSRSYHFERFASTVDDAAVRYPRDDERYEEHDDVLRSRVDVHGHERYEEHDDVLRSRVDVHRHLVDVRHHARLTAAEVRDVGPEELRTVEDDAHRPAAGDARHGRLRREKRAADLLEAEQSATLAHRRGI